MLKHSILRTAFGAFVMLGLLTSCGTSEQTNLNQTTSITMTGQVQRVNMKDTTSTGGDHLTEFLFISDNIVDDAAYLQSTTVTLDRFINKRVTLVGEWTNSSKSIFNVMSGDILLDEESASTGGTKSFSSTGLGVFFSYPAIWEAEELDNASIEVRDSKENTLLVTIFRVSAGRGETFDAWVKRNYPDATPEEYQVGLLVGQKLTKGSQEIILVNDNTSFYTLIFNTSLQGMDELVLARGYGTMQNALRFFTPGEADTGDDINTSEGAQNGSTGTPSDANTSNEGTNTGGNEGATGTSPVTSTPGSTTTTSGNTPKPIVQYILGNAESLIGAGSKVAQVEVAGNKYVYVTYTLNDEKKKVLLEYVANGSSYTVNTVASFDQGTSTTWVKTAGTNSAANTEREVYQVSESGNAKKTAVVEQGKGLYNNSQIDFQVQYPKNWYYSGENIVNEGGLQKVTFSNKPLDENPESKVEVKVYAKNGIDLSAAQKTTVGDKEGYLIKDANGVEQLAVKGDDGRVYVSGAGPENQKVAEDILKTLITK